MGWVWSGDDDGDNGNYDTQINTSSRDISSGSGSATQKIVRSHCKTEEIEPGKFVRKCEKTEELLRNCAGKPVEVLQSNKEYTEEDITDEVLKGRSATFGSSNSSSDRSAYSFPGLRSDIEALERGFYRDFSRFFDVAAAEIKNGFSDIFANSSSISSIFDKPASSSSKRQGIPVEEYSQQEASPKSKDTESVDTDFAALAKDV